MLNITKNTNETELTVALTGRLDTTTAPELEKEMKVIHVGDTIMEIFEVTGFSDILTIE